MLHERSLRCEGIIEAFEQRTWFCDQARIVERGIHVLGSVGRRGVEAAGLGRAHVLVALEDV